MPGSSPPLAGAGARQDRENSDALDSESLDSDALDSEFLDSDALDSDPIDSARGRARVSRVGDGARKRMRRANERRRLARRRRFREPRRTARPPERECRGPGGPTWPRVAGKGREPPLPARVAWRRRRAPASGRRRRAPASGRRRRAPAPWGGWNSVAAQRRLEQGQSGWRGARAAARGWTPPALLPTWARASVEQAESESEGAAREAMRSGQRGSRRRSGGRETSEAGKRVAGLF
jgi:hypothetical protein